MKEATQKGRHIVWFHLAKESKSTETVETDQQLPRFGRTGGLAGDS